MSENKNHQQRIADNLQGAYVFDVKNVMKKAWDVTLPTLATFVAMLFVTLVCALVLAAIYLNVQGIDSIEQITLELINVFDLIVRILLAPMLAALMMQGVKNANQQSSRVTDVFSLFNKMLPLALVTVIVTSLTLLGMALFVIPGVYVVISSGFAVMLVADKQYSASQAIVLSVKMVNRYLAKFIVLYIILFLLLIASWLTYGIGLIVFLPFYYNVKGVLYSELFGDKDTHQDVTTDNQKERVFEA